MVLTGKIKQFFGCV